ncbi:DUF1294 domain-containing protein [Aureimonas sp. AU12]|uniref:DUF1294 domain-containing protein n=1 Tax=Aureimonas sp. AU12 TaxID=1638161 RepID=UPI0009EA5589|nr:DUF1294 domain-containing protein [Aureimonas sp. AU12]
MPFVAAYFVIVNIAAYGAMALDKAKAEAGHRRIPERKLLGLALIGGSIGTVLAQRMVRHKTRKEPFRSRLIGIVVLQIGLLAVAAVAGPDRIIAGFTALTETPVAGQAGR